MPVFKENKVIFLFLEKDINFFKELGPECQKVGCNSGGAMRSFVSDASFVFNK